MESSSNRQKEALISEQKPKQTEAVEKTIQKAILAVRRCIYTTSRKFHWENYKTCTHRRYRFHCENRKAKQNRRLARSGKLWKSRNSFAQALFIFNAMTISTPGGATAPSQLFPLIARSRLKISTSFCYDRSSFIIVHYRRVTCSWGTNENSHKFFTPRGMWIPFSASFSASSSLDQHISWSLGRSRWRLAYRVYMWGSKCLSFGCHRTVLALSCCFCHSGIYLLRHQVAPRFPVVY